MASPLRIRKRLRAAFCPDTMEKQLIQLKEKANKTHSDLIFRSHGGTPLTQLVEFYRLVSPWCDRRAELYELERKLDRIDYGQHTRARQALWALAAQEERYMNGVNQTLPGQVPSMDTTFLGNYSGLWTKTVAYWEEHRDKFNNLPAIIGQSEPTIMALIDAQASSLLKDGLDRWFKLLYDLFDS